MERDVHRAQNNNHVSSSVKLKPTWSQRKNSTQNEIMINYYSFLTQPVCVCLGKGKILWHGRENYYKECLCHFRKFGFAFLDVCNIVNNDWEIVFKLWKQSLRKVKSAKVPGRDSHFVSPRKCVFVITKDMSVRSSLWSFKLVQLLCLFWIPLMLIQTPPSLWHHCSPPWKTAVSFRGN